MSFVLHHNANVLHGKHFIHGKVTYLLISYKGIVTLLGYLANVS